MSAAVLLTVSDLTGGWNVVTGYLETESYHSGSGLFTLGPLKTIKSHEWNCRLVRADTGSVTGPYPTIMNLNPIPGDRWTLTLEVVSVEKGIVHYRRGVEDVKMPLSDYLTLATECVVNGATLHRTETEDPEFE